MKRLGKYRKILDRASESPESPSSLPEARSGAPVILSHCSCGRLSWDHYSDRCLFSHRASMEHRRVGRHERVGV